MGSFSDDLEEKKRPLPTPTTVLRKQLPSMRSNFGPKKMVGLGGFWCYEMACRRNKEHLQPHPLLEPGAASSFKSSLNSILRKKFS